MSSISFTAHGRCARATVCEPITTGSVGLSVSFAFDAAWSGLQKTAIFRGSGMAVDLVLSGDAATVPPEVLTIPGGDLRVGVWGADPDGNVIIPTVWATVGEIVPGAAPSGIDPQPPAPSWAAQVQEIAQDALDTANSVREDADAGAFDGATYTPAVSAGGDLSWTNDKGKPNPPTVNIKGPEGQPGQTGATPDISIGTVETLPPGSPATATMTGTAENPVLSFGIPQGQQGAPGEVTQAEFDALADEVTQQKSAIEAHEQYAEETYAKQDGTYEDLTAGNAYELLSDRGDTNQQPYLFRQTGGDSSAYNREQVRKIVGGTVAWNQLVKNGNFDGVASWKRSNVTIDATDNVLTITKAAGYGYGTGYCYQSVPVVSGHKYLERAEYKNVENTTQIRLFETGSGDINISDTNWHTVERIVTHGTAATYDCMLWNRSTNADSSMVMQLRNVMEIDLTQMFGTAIADYIYSLEQATAGAGVAFFRSLFPADYYDYNPGELMSVEGVSAHETVGFNQWGGTSDSIGKSIAADGSLQNSSNYCVSDYIRVLPNTTYYLKNIAPSANARTMYCYGYDKSPITAVGLSGTQNVPASGLATTVDGTHFVRIVRFASTTEYGFNLSDPARNGAYEPYKKRTYPLDDSLTLRGIPKLDSNNRLYYDGDTYEPDGTVTRRYGIVDLGTLNWMLYPGYSNLFYLNNLGIAKQPNAYTAVNIVQGKYTLCLENQIGKTGYQDGFISGAQSDRIYINDTNYTDAASFKAALSGVMMVYELATPTTETAEPYRELEICDRDGTEEFVSTSVVPVGHETFYPVNVFDYIDRLTEPDADMIADNVIAANKYFSVGNRLFLSTASIASGAQIIPGTNCTETSLAAALNALNA